MSDKEKPRPLGERPGLLRRRAGGDKNRTPANRRPSPERKQNLHGFQLGGFLENDRRAFERLPASHPRRSPTLPKLALPPLDDNPDKRGAR
jgi:hypothetical protein